MMRSSTIQALQSDGSKDIPKRVLNVDEDTLKKKNLHDYITSTLESLAFCQESHFLDAFQILKHGISMMDTFLLGEMPTRDEEQKHNLLAASEHRRCYPNLKTVTLTCLCQSK